MRRIPETCNRYTGMAAMVLAALAGWLLEPAPAWAQIVPPGSTVEGLSIGEWGARWWDWLLSEPSAMSPATDPTGRWQNRGQTPPVFFMCAAEPTAMARLTRVFTVPGNQPILVGLSTIAAVPALGEDPATLCQQASNYLDFTTLMSFSLDGVPISEATLFAQHREASGFFTCTADADNPFGIDPGTWTDCCVHGYFVMLEPLAPGKHEIQCAFTHHSEAELDLTNRVAVIEPVLGFVEFEQDGLGGVDGLNDPGSVAVSPDGAHVYVAARLDDAVAVFARDASTGALTFIEAQVDGVGGVNGLAAAQSLALSPDGAHLYVAGRDDDAVAVFDRDAGTGALTFVEVQIHGADGVSGLEAVSALGMSPDGAHVYALGGIADAVVVFARNASTGALTFVEVEFDGLAGVDGLASPTSVSASPDGAHLYVTAQADSAIAVFERDASTGALTFVEAQVDGVNGVAGLGNPRSVAVSPDGAHVYVAALEDGVAIFARNPATGALTFLTFEDDIATGVPGLRDPESVAVSPSGAHVHVASRGDDGLAMFERDAATGSLTLVDLVQDGVGGVDGLAGAVSVAVSPDSTSVYVVGSGDDAVAAFTLVPEPSASLLLISGIGFVIAVGRRRMRS